MTAYTPTTWTDEVPASSPVKYTLKDSGGSVIEDDVTIEVKTVITTEGTPLNATNLNKMETGIKNAQDAADDAQDAADAAQTDADLGVIAYGWRDNSYTLYLNGNETLTTSHKVLYRIPNLVEYTNGAELIGIAGCCLDASSSGNITLTLKKNGVSVLTTNITIEAGETDTLTATVQAVIDATKKNFAIGDKLLAEVTGAGVGVTHCQIEVIFRPIEV